MFVAVGAGLVLAACSDLSDALRGVKDPPDEFSVSTKSPLVIPPDYNLRSPQPGAPARNEPDSHDQALASLYPQDMLAQTAALGDAYSDGEKLLLAKTNALAVDPRIRQQFAADMGQNDQGSGLIQSQPLQEASMMPTTPAPGGRRTVFRLLFPEAAPTPSTGMGNPPLQGMSTTPATTNTSSVTQMMVESSLQQASMMPATPAPNERRTLLRLLFPETTPAPSSGMGSPTLQDANMMPVAPTPSERRTVLRLLFPETMPAPSTRMAEPLLQGGMSMTPAAASAPAPTPGAGELSLQDTNTMPAAPAPRERRTLLRLLFPETTPAPSSGMGDPSLQGASTTPATTGAPAATPGMGGSPSPAAAH
jgi:hypothetical protein